MVRPWQLWVLTVVAAATAAMVLANMVRFSANRQLQSEVSQRNLFIQQSIPLENLGREIALALAQLGVRSQDEQIRTLFNSLGISVQVNPPAAAPATADSRGERK